MVTERIKKYFDIEELACPHISKRDGERAWIYFDPRLIANLLFVREGIGLPIFANNWAIGGNLSQRGFRCNICALVKEKTALEKLYMTPHTGMAVDFDVKGMSALEVRNWIKEHEVEMPYPCRLEADVNWVHMDTRTDGANGKVTYFYA